MASSLKQRGQKNPRPKHRPQRTCVACGVKDGKRELVRIVRTPEGVVAVDPTGRANGRGAYLCPVRRCWEIGLERGSLSRALKTSIEDSNRDELRNYGQTLEAAPPAETLSGNTQA